MKRRKSISTRQRFEVFKRDQFTCQYCGAHPPAVILHVDHITPVADGGSNELENLVTACERCNLGKAAVPLSSVPESLAKKAEEIAEREAQLSGYQEILEFRARRLDAESWDVAGILDPNVPDRGFDRRNLISIRRFIEQLGVHEVKEAAEAAYCKVRHGDYQRFRYFCGICWNKIRRGQDALAQH